MWSDIDFEGKTLTVARNRVELGGGKTTVVENEPKTEAARRTLPLDGGLWGVLKRGLGAAGGGEAGARRGLCRQRVCRLALRAASHTRRARSRIYGGRSRTLLG